MAASNSRRLAAFLLIAVFANGSLSCAQGRTAGEEFEPISSATTALLQQMTRSAGVIFAGEVVSVVRPGGSAGSGQDADEGVVVIAFRVHNAVRGCTSGSIYTLREWAALWAGRDHYRVGDHLLLFLHSQDANGLGSPVHGLAGAIPLRGGAVAPGPYNASAIAGGWLVDLRWVDAQAMRDATPLQTPVGGPVLHPLAVRRPEAESGAIFAQDTHQPELGAEPELVKRNLISWRGLPHGSDRSMQPLSQILSLCAAWARSSDEVQ